jgi:hypothetical protein
MQIRHIRPRSVDWYDATFETQDRGFDWLSPEEKTKLRRMGQPEPDRLAPILHGAPLEPRGGPSRQLL